jgi:hypothetical protein
LANIGAHSSIREGYLPRINVTIEKLKTFASFGKNEVVGYTFVIVEEIILNKIRPIPEAENEIIIAVMGIILHDMP